MSDVQRHDALAGINQSALDGADVEQQQSAKGPIASTQESETGAVIGELRRAVQMAVIGNGEALTLMAVTLICGGHVLLEDVPGVGKTLLARSMARALDCTFKRLQLTPDVLPSDITGSTVFNQGVGKFEFHPGPIFTQVLLADEINRATPRTQSALLEAMEEHQVSVDGVTHPLDEVFFVLATENPLELEGTYPLPEAQLDRFLMRITLGYPDRAAEERIVTLYGEHDPPEVPQVLTTQDIRRLRERRSKVVVGRAVLDYLLDITRATREDARFVLGASPRASLALFKAAQALALLRERDFVTPDDVKELVAPVLSHRLILASSARLHGLTAASILEDQLNEISVPVEDVTGS